MSVADKIGENETNRKLTEYRKSIDNIDAAIINMLAERFKITQKVGIYKARFGLPPADKSREKQQIERLRKLAKEAQLEPDFSEKFLELSSSFVNLVNVFVKLSRSSSLLCS